MPEWLKSFDMTYVFCGRTKRARSRKTQDCLFNSYWSRAPLLSWSSHIGPGPELVGHTAAKIQSNDALFSTLETHYGKQETDLILFCALSKSSRLSFTEGGCWVSVAYI